MAAPLFELRPRSAGDILDQALRLYRRHFVSILRLVLVPFALTVPLSIWEDSVSDGVEGLQDLLRILPLSSALLVAIQWLGSLGEAALARWVANPDVSPTASLWKFYGPVLRRGISLACVAVLSFMLWVGTVLLPIGGMIGVAVAAVDSRGLGMATLLVGAALAAIALGGMVIVTRLSLTVVVIVLEDVSWPAGLRRSWRLVRGQFWRTAAIVLFALAFAFGPLLLFKFTGSLVYEIMSPPTERFLIQVVTVVISPIALIALALLYYDCRIRQEALDLEVMAQRIDAPQNPSAGGLP